MHFLVLLPLFFAASTDESPAEQTVHKVSIADLRLDGELPAHTAAVDWRLSRNNVPSVERYLIDMPHKKLVTSDERHKRMLRRFQAFGDKHPDQPFTSYRDRHKWL